MTPGPAKQFNREEVLGRALHLFWAQGYEATGMSQLQSCLGIGRQSLYDTFGNKKNLYLEALKHYFAYRQQLSREILSRPGSVMDNLEELLETMFQLAQDTDYCGCFVGNSVAEFGHRDDEMRESLGGFLDRMERLFATSLERARDQGELSNGASPEAIAKLLVVSFQGLALVSKLRDPESVQEAAFTLLNLVRSH